MRTLLIFLLAFSSLCYANTNFTTQIHDIDYGVNNEDIFIYLTNGRVVFLPKNELSLLDTIKAGHQSKAWFQIEINDEKKILRLLKIQKDLNKNILQKASKDNSGFQPSILKNMDQARSFFQEARTNARQESECFNRAHAWAYEWRINHQLYSSKTWLFFTRRYIRKYKFDWWFHVAPSVHVIDSGEVKEKIMDIKYAKGPIRLKTWTDIFLRNRADCPVVEKYTDHANYPESGSCFVMKSSMYYYQPIDLELLEMTGDIKQRWIETEVRNAFQDAFEMEI